MLKKYFIFFFLFAAQLSAQINLGNQEQTGNLTGVGLISVTIGGDFAVTGTYPASITERVDQFITRMYEEARQKAFSISNDPQIIQQIEDKLENYSLRNIKLKRANGDVRNIDLLMFRVTGNFENNPYLKNDDVLIFAPADLEYDFFTIDGAIKKPGKYSYVEGDMLSDALTLAQGISPAYGNISGIEINRLDQATGKFDVIELNVDDDVPLQRGDRIRVIAFQSDKKVFNVTIVGEVNIPGKIPITRNNTTLKEVIEKAGGIRESAALNKARLFTGKSIKYLLEEQFGVDILDSYLATEPDLTGLLVEVENMEMSRMSNLTFEDTAYFFMENRLRVFNEGSSIDFENVMNDTSEAANYIVEDGDVIIIPQKLNSVYVFGQVPKIGYIPYVEGKDYNYYIEKAGGPGEYAEDEIMVIKGKTKHWISTEEKENILIEEGDYIWVPKEQLRTFNWYIGQIGTYLSIVSSVATVILLLVQFNK